MVKAVSHPFFARIYPRIIAFTEAHGSIEHRQELLAGVHGRVVEIGAGRGELPALSARGDAGGGGGAGTETPGSRR